MKSPFRSERRSLPANRAIRVLALLSMAAPALTGCAERMERATVVQAAYDFKCAQDQVTTEKLAFAEYRATGCGKTASYQLIGECYFDWNPCHAARLQDVEPAPPLRQPDATH